MIKSLNIPQNQLTIPQRLIQICKKSAISVDNKPQIDFILLDRQMQQLQHIQSKTVQQIVQFVDQHLQQFIQINKKFQAIQQNVSQSQLIIKKLIPKLDTYKSKLFSPQSKIQQFMTAYQKKLMQQQLTEIAKQQTQFLLGFIHDFQNFININVQQLNQKHKYNIVRLLRKKQYIKSIFEHPLIQNVSHCTNDLCIMLANITQQLEFYLSEQLSRIATSKDLRNQRIGGLSLLQQIQLWYQYMGKDQGFFQIIEESIIGRKLSALELLLTSHKQNLIVGLEQHIVKQFFNDLFELVEEFPTDYPIQRILKIIYRFLGKKQLNFIYSYVVPTFPISYSAYKAAVSKIRNNALRNQLQTKHGWNLKLWADLRIKTIMDRSSKDKDKSLTKWLDIVFKKSFMIHGVKNYMIKLAFLLINRHCLKIQQEIQFNSKNLNDNFSMFQSVKDTLRARLTQGFVDELNDEKQTEINKKIITQNIQKTIQNVTGIIEKTLRKWIVLNMEMIVNSCKKSLQPFKSFVLNIISRKDRQRILPNTRQNILKPLKSYIKNNPQISQNCCKFLQKIIMQQIQKHYDSQYAKQIYNDCQSNISTEQMKLVMEIVAAQRQSLFQNPIQASGNSPDRKNKQSKPKY